MASAGKCRINFRSVWLVNLVFIDEFEFEVESNGLELPLVPIGTFGVPGSTQSILLLSSKECLYSQWSNFVSCILPTKTVGV